MPQRKLPKIIQEVGFDFHWSEPKVWALNVPTESVDMRELEWHFDIPFWDKPGGYYDLKPRDVINHPEKHKREYARTMRADLSHPLDIMSWKGRWLLLDGLHRLVKAKILGKRSVSVRKISQEHVPYISKQS